MTGHYALVNGINLYYEVHGTGQPLILLHGGLGTIDWLFGDLIPPLAEHRQVIAVELQAHGHTEDVDRPMRYETMADDIAALIQQLGLEQADVCGFSLGGGVALQTAIRHPHLVRKLALISTPFQRHGWYSEVLEGMGGLVYPGVADSMVGTPMHTAYMQVAPKPEQWSTLVVKTAQLLGEEYDWSEGVAGLSMPTLLVFGDADSISPAHMIEMYSLLGGGKKDGDIANLPIGRLAVLPSVTHLTILSHIDLLLAVLTPFLQEDSAPVET
jgi:pimeloyl-ACP methyl ester carboxylesterase